jgi:hypothetical protein
VFSRALQNGDLSKAVRKSESETSLDEGYRAMAADKAREAEAMEWCNALARERVDATR